MFLLAEHAERSGASRSSRFRTGRLSLFVLLVSLVSCARRGEKSIEASTLAELVASTRTTGLKVLIVGIDGATFSCIDPLLAERRLPAISGLIERGARGPLESQAPMISAAVWTTLLTGRNREQHGIMDFSVREGRGKNRRCRMVSSLDRRSLALWNLTEPFGLSSGFAGWWASWPAEPVKGWIVTDRMARERFTEWLQADRSSRLTYPDALATELSPLVVDPLSAPMAELAELADFTDEELAEMQAVTHPIRYHWPSVLKFAFTAQRSYEKMTLHLLGQGQPDLTGVFLIANDPICHTTWHFYEPASFPPGSVKEDQAARLGELIPRVYEHNDRFLGDLLRVTARNTVVIVVSDHGFESSGKLPVDESADRYAAAFDERRREALRDGTVAVGQSGMHHLEGIFIAAGGPILRGVRCEATVLDLLPTVLALLGLPVPEDVPGRVLEEILDPAFLEEHPVRRIPSYEPLIERPRTPVDRTPDDQSAMEMLRSLGYVK